MTDQLLPNWFLKNCPKLIKQEMSGAKVSFFGKCEKIFEAKIRQTIDQTLRDKGLMPGDFCVDVNFFSPSKMRKYNMKFRGKDYATDVLSFGQFDDVVNFLPTSGLVRPVMLGDLVLCEEVIRAEAEEEKTDLETHLMMLVEHGMLHLLGIHHPED